MNQGIVTIDKDGAGGLLICFPDGSIVGASNKKHAQSLVKRWAQRQTDIVAKVSGRPTVSHLKVQWMNGSNYE